jgi:hypothetical protein
MTFINDNSRKGWVYFLKKKIDVFIIFKQWKVSVENRTGKKIKGLSTDNCMQFCSGDFDKFCKNEGIARHRTVRQTPQQNEVFEQISMSLLERARCMLSNAGLSKNFLAEVVNIACYFVSCSPLIAIGCKTFYEVWFGTFADYSNLKTFGCFAYCYVNEGKLKLWSNECIFLGYADGVK